MLTCPPCDSMFRWDGALFTVLVWPYSLATHAANISRARRLGEPLGLLLWNLLKNGVQALLEVGLRPEANNLPDRLPTLEDEQRGNAANAVLHGRLWIIVRVQLHEVDFARVLVGELFDD